MTVGTLDPRILDYAADLGERVVRARDAIADGEFDLADVLLERVETDLGCWRAWVAEWVASDELREAA